MSISGVSWVDSIMFRKCFKVVYKVSPGSYEDALWHSLGRFERVFLLGSKLPVISESV